MENINEIERRKEVAELARETLNDLTEH